MVMINHDRFSSSSWLLSLNPEQLELPCNYLANLIVKFNLDGRPLMSFYVLRLCTSKLLQLFSPQNSTCGFLAKESTTCFLLLLEGRSSQDGASSSCREETGVRCGSWGHQEEKLSVFALIFHKEIGRQTDRLFSQSPGSSAVFLVIVTE